MRQLIITIQQGGRKGTLPLEENVSKAKETFFTTPLFWDCECRDNFIHASLEDFCPRCGARRETQPDSRVTEVVSQLGFGTLAAYTMAVSAGE